MPAPRPSTPEERRARMLRELAADAGGDTRHLVLRGSQGMFNRAADKATGEGYFVRDLNQHMSSGTIDIIE